MNSFFLNDLKTIQRNFGDKNDNGKALRQYLGILPCDKQYNLLKDNKILQDILSPTNTPPGRWPSPGRHPLVLLQQAAVNLATTTLKNEGLFSVNGPPGTGKTTLLRDIITSIIVKRAEALNKFEHPHDAFTKSDNLYKINESLKGHDIIVASSNNNAVENISKELPQLSQISKDLEEELDYFRLTSDALAEYEYQTWGLLSAPLGNGKNRTHFNDTFW